MDNEYEITEGIEVETTYHVESKSRKLEIDESEESSETTLQLGSSDQADYLETVTLKKQGKCTKYKCDTCNKYFPARGHLQIHMRTHTGEKPFSCYLCGKKSARLHDLQTHILTHTDKKRYGCCYCPSRFNQKSNYTRHLKLHSPSLEKPKRQRKQYICNICQENLPNKNALLVHMSEHEGKKPFMCLTCDKGFTRQYDLKVHLRIHTGEKPYSCNICKLDFRQQSNYRRHLKMHEDK